MTDVEKLATNEQSLLVPVGQFLSGIGWPLVTLIFAIVFIVLFRKPLYGFISRLTSLGAAGVTVTAITPVQPGASVADSPKPATVSTDHLKEYPFFCSVQKGKLTAELELVSSTDMQSYLMDHLIFVRSIYLFENIFFHIFGGQIRLLNLLNGVQGVGMSETDLHILWREHQQRLAPVLDAWDGERYLSFLYYHQFILKQNGVVQIGRIGVEFLMWMARNGRNENQKAL